MICRRLVMRPTPSNGRHSPRAAFLALDYFRELLLLSVGVAALLFVSRAGGLVEANAARVSGNDRPVYALFPVATGEAIWVVRNRYGLARINLQTANETDRWQLQFEEMIAASFGGQAGSETLVVASLEGPLRLLHNGFLEWSSDQLPFREVFVSSWVRADGRQCVLATRRHVIRLTRATSGTWNTEQWQLPKLVTRMATAPSGQQIAVGQGADEIAVLDETGEFRLLVEGLRSRICCLAWGPDGERLAASLGDGSAALWSVRDRCCLWSTPVEKLEACALAFTPDGKQLAIGGFDCALRLIACDDGRLERVFRGHEGAIRSVAFPGRDAATVITGGLDGRVIEWSLKTALKVREL